MSYGIKISIVDGGSSSEQRIIQRVRKEIDIGMEFISYWTLVKGNRDVVLNMS